MGLDRATRRMLVESLNRDAQRIAQCFGLRYRAVKAERSNVKSRYGICYSDGSIRIRLVHAVTGRPLRYSSLVNTLCHELAHLRHFDHGLRFRAFYLEALEFARQQGIYRPRSERPARPLDPPPPRRPAAPAGPTQLTLFG